MNKVILKILIVISIIIIVGGIFVAINIRNEIHNEDMTTNRIYLEGADITNAIGAFAEIGSGLLVMVIVFYSIFVVTCIWGIYGIVLLIVIIIKKYKSKKYKA